MIYIPCAKKKVTCIIWHNLFYFFSKDYWFEVKLEVSLAGKEATTSFAIDLLILESTSKIWDLSGRLCDLFIYFAGGWWWWMGGMWRWAYLCLLAPGGTDWFTEGTLATCWKAKDDAKVVLLVGYDDSLPVGQLQYCKDCQQDTFDLALPVVFLDGVWNLPWRNEGKEHLKVTHVHIAALT